MPRRPAMSIAASPFRRPGRLLAQCLTCTLLVVFIVGARSAAQEPAPTAGSSRPPTQAELEALREDLAAGRARLVPLIEAIDVSAAEAWLAGSPLEQLNTRAAQAPADSDERARWQNAADIEEAAAERVRGALGRAELGRAADERLTEAEQRVDTMLSNELPIGAEESVPSEIEREIAALDNRRAEVALEVNQRRETLSRLEEQLRGQADTLDDLRRQREEQATAAVEAQADDAELTQAQEAIQQAQARRLEARIIAAQLDAQTLPARIERLRLGVRVSELDARWLGQQLVVLQEAFNQRSTQEIRALSTQLQSLIEREPEAQERFAGRIRRLRTRIDEVAQAQDRIRELQRTREEREAIANDLRQTLANVRERVEIGGLSETLGGMFLEEQRRLRRFNEERFELQEVESELAQSRLRVITLREQLEALPSASSGIVDDSVRSELRELERQAVGTLLQTEQTLAEQLGQSEARLREVVSLVDELGRLLRETLLWWPSHVPVSTEWATRLPVALRAVFDLEAWDETRTAVYAATLGSPIASVATLLLAALLYAGGRGARRDLKQIAEKTRHLYTDSIGLTFRALGWSVLRVLPVPVLLMSASYQLRQVPETGPGVETLAGVLFNAAIWWLAGHLFLLFTSRNGVGTAHLQWSPSIVRRLKRNLLWYIPIQFLLVVGLGLALGHPNDVVFDVFGRAALVFSGILSGLLVWNVLAPLANAERAADDRWRRLVRVVTAIYAMGLVALALAGYLLTVNELLARTIYTAVVLGAGWFGYRLAMRALKLSELRLEVRRRLEERANAAALEGSPVVDASVEDAEPMLSIEDINAQTRKLLNVATGGLVVLALFWVWAEVLPALTWLDNITLWSRNFTIGDTEVSTRITLQDMLLAAFLGALFVMAARNLPGLVEIVLARSTGMDAPGRYTIAMLLRYVLAVVGGIMVFGMIGLRWAELQWLVAALTLGLGFGLQEVVANFFSGIIMLFERPVRVGDTITIGEFSGTVTKIRTRATTIMDWDNREIVVPNKMFITERLINWTLTDTMTRIVLPVGVSYDSDVDLVTRTLLEVAHQHPLVMKEPEPTALFLKFGDNALGFELRAYVEQMDNRLPVMSELHSAIVRAFRARGIEIAYPQMDLHIRDVPASSPPVAQSVPAATGSGGV